MPSVPLPLSDPPDGPDLFGLPDGGGGALVQVIEAPFELSVSYGAGTRHGPRAILEASSQLDLLDQDFGRPWRAGIHFRRCPGEWQRINDRLPKRPRDGEAHPAVQRRVNAAGTRVNRLVHAAVGRHLRSGHIVGTLGGEHSVALPSIAAHARHHGAIGVLQVDAHMDLRESYQGLTWSHASVMANVLREVPAVTRLVQVGVRDYCEEELQRVRDSGGRIVPWTGKDVRACRHGAKGFAALAERIIEPLPRRVYVSFDIDGLDPALCPHTGTPVPGGLQFDEAVTLLQVLVASGRVIVGFDLCEVAPGPDEWDANVGARVLYKLIGATLATRLTSLSPG